MLNPPNRRGTDPYARWCGVAGAPGIAAILYSILLPRRRHCRCIPHSLRWRVLDPRTGEPQAADPGYVVGGEPAPKATGASDAIRAPLTMGCSVRSSREP